jgi:serine phosphatase RsbU (regulator of sigma subunit)
MKKKIPVLVFILTLSSIRHVGYGQDTLLPKQDLGTVKFADSLRAMAFYNKGKNFALASQYDSASTNISRSLEIASEGGFLNTEATAYELLALISDQQSRWDDALENYLRASLAYAKAGDSFNEARVFKLIADKYFKAGVYKKSAQYAGQEFLLYGDSNRGKKATSAELAGNSYYYLIADSLSLKWYSIAASHYLECADSSGYLRCIEKLGSVYTRAGLYDMAYDEYNKLLSVYSRRNDYVNLAMVCNQKGFLSFRKSDLNGALDQFNLASDYSVKGGNDNFLLTDIWSNIAICHQNMGNQDEMVKCFNTAIKYAKESGRIDEVARIERILAKVYYNKSDNYHAELYCLDCIESAKKSMNLDVLQLCYKDYSAVLESGNDFAKALEYYEKYLNLRDSLNYENRLAEKEKADMLARLDDSEQRIRNEISEKEIHGLELKNLKAETVRKENELKLLQKQQELDRSEKDRLSQSLALEKERFELARKEEDINSLKQQQYINLLLLKQKDDSSKALVTENQLLEKDKLQKETQLKNEKLARKFAVGIGSLMLIAAAIILSGLISVRKRNRKLAESKREIEMINSDLELKNDQIVRQKDIIEQKNQSITDSIQYASRIQAAVFPPLTFLSDWGLDNFILFKPKDIVSGDFYWGVRKNDKIIVAAADCTGHGVPGAFMSMLGHAFLDEIVNTREVENAAYILNCLRDEVINTLKQKGATGEARDGMDVSLVIIDLNAGRLDYAGANNPLYLVRKGRLIKYSADSMPIGIHFISFTPFTNQSIEIMKGDCIYLFSDGYADQFGGPRGKKFMYKNFQNLLLANYEKPVSIQNEILDETFGKWKGDREQVDDVLVIGIHI